MDKKRTKSKKREIQTNEGHKEAEMFVLPPDVLEKLGINLGQFTSPLLNPGNSHTPEVNNGNLTTEPKNKAAKSFVSPMDVPNANDNINKSDEYNEHPSVLQKLLQSEAVFTNASFKSVSAEQGTFKTHDVTMSSSEANLANNGSSSILETANLMKESVLLSPTFSNTDFIPNTSDQISEIKESSVVPVTLICTKNVTNPSETINNVDLKSPSYVEIWTADVNINNELKADNNDENDTSLHESITTNDSAHWKATYPETFNALSGLSQPTNNVNTINSGDSNIKTITMDEEFAFSSKYHESNNNNNFTSSIVSNDCDESNDTIGGNLDEIYSSEANNQEYKSKIKIISEQILNPDQLKQIQNACASHKSTFMPVSVETLIRKTPEAEELLNNSSMYAESEFVSDKELYDKNESTDIKPAPNLTETFGQKLSIADGNKNVKLITNSYDLICDSKQTVKSKYETRKTSSSKKSINKSMPDSNIIKKSVPSLRCVDETDRSSNNKSSTVNEDKVKEIASYLVQLVNNRNKQHKKVESGKRIYKCYKRHPHKTKLVSQGLETPGGKIEINIESVSDTKLILQESLNSINMDSLISNDDIICIGATSDKYELTQKLCVCVDFGKLDYYNEDDYENIHFWYHKKDICEPELCYSIYNDFKVSYHPEDDIPMLDVLRVSTPDTLISNSKSTEESKMIYEDASSSNTPGNTPAAKKPDKRGRPKKNIKKDNTEELDGRDFLINNSNSVEESKVIYEDASSSNTPVNTPAAKIPDKRGRPKENIKKDNTEELDGSDILINNSISVEESKVIYEDASSSNTPVNTPVAKKPDKRGRPKKNITKDNTEELDSSDILINNSKSVEKSKVTSEGASTTPAINTSVPTLAINTSVSEQPVKRGRGRPKKIFKKTETDSTISDRMSSSKDNINTDNNPSRRPSSISSSDEPLILKKSKILSNINTQPVKNEQTDNVLPECKVSDDGFSIANSSTNNHETRCAICKEEVTAENWFEHRKIHNYLAWRNTEPALDLDDEYAVIRHLTFIAKEHGNLSCSTCQKQYKTPKSYYGHVQICGGDVSNMDNSTASDLNLIFTQESLADEETDEVKSKKKRKRTTVDEIIECGVCNENVKNIDWIEHIRVKHNYLAKRAGEIALDENNEEEVKEHLYNICKYYGGLICNKCGLKRKYLKSYFTHIMACNGLVEEIEPEIDKIDIDCKDIVKCGVCKLDVYEKLWINHIQKVHKYLAWIEGEPPLNIEDPIEVHDHLLSISRTTGCLRCWVCGETRKIVKIFLQHTNLCESTGLGKFKPVEKDPNVSADQFECGICHEIGYNDNWKQHAMLKHYNVAWKMGERPINLKNPYAVEKYLKEYKLKNNLVCKVCGETRVSCYGFYAHILICGKSEAELEELHNICEICNKKYVCIYKNQHMASHRDSELRKERRERDAELMAAKAEKRQRELEESFEPGRKRKAAERASKVIQDFKQEDDEGPSAKRSRSDSEDSVKMEVMNGESSDDDADVESDISDEALEVEGRKRDNRKKTQHMSKIPRLPFKVDRFSIYVKKSYKDFSDYHFTDDCLFNDWRHTNLQLVSESVSQYLPSVTESCLIKYGDNKWTSYKRFEAAKIGRGLILYTGGCIQCLSWAPQPTKINESFYFAVSTHKGSDLPRFDKDSTPVHPGLIQIWSLTDFYGALPEFSLGLLHDYGTIWAMDWCPSGARDILSNREEKLTKYRLGLLAIACSNGFAYVLSVPYPDVKQSEMTICKAVPVAELRLNMNSNKKIYQATAITWSTQKGHSIIGVGYADGTTALYDLCTNSPLLTKKEDNITVIYPFQDKRTENGPISGVSVTPSMDSSRPLGGVCAGGAGGAGVWPARRGLTQRTTLAVTGIGSTPHWPSYLLCAEIAVSSKVVNDLELVGGGRRMGGACSSGVCGRCACAVLSAPPLLRLVRAHPCYPEPRRPLTLATLRMVPLNAKPVIKTDDFSMVIEPLTYEDTVSKYGLELKLTVKSKNPPKISNELEQRPERFPLSDVRAISFCPSDRYHNRVAIASHSGLVFILNTAD